MDRLRVDVGSHIEDRDRGAAARERADDLAGTASGTYTWNGEGPGIVDLSASATRADALHLAHYLPLATLMGAQNSCFRASRETGASASTC